ncbi:MAG TPA: AraC family transcriptional regulator [Rhizomicrobium sp.]|jgi:AraC-like DNA-binding protein|nr:AraC family transcriptional regulator [Rhizomicrobium sp.]
MAFSRNSVVIPEDDYMGGPVLFSGPNREDGFSFWRLRIKTPNPDIALSKGGKPGYVAKVYLAPVGKQIGSHGGKSLSVPPRRAGETSIRDVGDLALCQLTNPLDLLSFNLPETALTRWSESSRQVKRFQLKLQSGLSVMDQTLMAFGRAALVTLEHPEHTAQFFVDHLMAGVCSYLFDRFAEPPSITNGGLAPWQGRRAKELIESRLGADLSLDELAFECGLSVAHFTRAFRQTVGETPHRWLMRRRVQTAQLLLLSTGKPLAQIAVECGFSDQAHFTKTFARLVGAPPGAFRREQNGKNKH